MQKRRQQSSIATRVIAVILAIILALGIAYGVTAIVKKQANPIKWFEDEKTVEEKSPVGTMMLEFDNKADAPMKIGYKPTSKTSNMATSAAATIAEPTAQNVAKGNSIEVAVTTNPVDASIQTVTWGVAWTSSSDSWAQGKNAMDYIQIEPSEDDTKHATITCLQPFGATITIICTSDDKDDGTISATCKAQYAKRVTGVDLTIETYYDYADEDGELNNKQTYVSFSSTRDNNSLKYNVVANKKEAQKLDLYGNYESRFFATLTEGTGTLSEMDFKQNVTIYSSDIQSDQPNKEKVKLVLRIKSDKKQAIASATGLQLPEVEYEMDGGNINVSEAIAQFFDGQSNVTNKRVAIYNSLQGYYNSNEAAFEFSLTFTGVSGTEYEFNFPVKIDVGALRTAVQSLPGLDDEYIF